MYWNVRCGLRKLRRDSAFPMKGKDLSSVMAALVAAISLSVESRKKDVDGRDKRGHDAE